MLPILSIIVPIYNVENYINKCIDSILNQTFEDFELILVNDGSQDSCGKICDEYSRKDRRVRVIHKPNGGLSDARNAGLEIASGQYIGFVDGDDWIEPEMYETLYNLSRKYNSDISTCFIHSHDKKPKNKKRVFSNGIRVLNSESAIEQLYSGKLTGYSACNKLYSQKVFSKIRFPVNRIYEDAAIMYRLFDKANKVVCIESALYNYQSREFSITRHSFSEKRFDIVKNYQETYNFMQKKYPEMCDPLNAIYYSSLRNMIVDIVNEKSVVKNFRYIKKVCSLIRKNKEQILKNKLISINKKILAIVLSLSPLAGVLLYRIRLI